MNARKSLTAAVAAATVVGAIGLAYAQTSTDSTTPPPGSDMNSPRPQPASDTPAMPATPPAAPDRSAAPAAADSTAMPAPAAARPAPSDAAAPMPTDRALPDSTINNAAGEPAMPSTEPAPKADRN